LLNVQRGLGVEIKDNLERGEASCLTWCPIEGKFDKREQLTLPFDVLFDKNPKQGVQGLIGQFSLSIHLGVASCGKLEMSSHLSMES